jgi:hypothetical protein
MAFVQLIESTVGTAGRKVMLNTDCIQRVDPDPRAPTVTLVTIIGEGKKEELHIVGDYDAVSSQIASAHLQALKPLKRRDPSHETFFDGLGTRRDPRHWRSSGSAACDCSAHPLAEGHAAHG